MKILVKKIIEDRCFYGGRNSDGSYWNSEINTKIEVYSDKKVELIAVAKKIKSFIQRNTSSEIWKDCGYGPSSIEEKYCSELTQNLVDILQKLDNNVEVGDEDCTILLYPDSLLDYPERKQRELIKQVTEINQKLKKEIIALETKATSDKAQLTANIVLDCYLQMPNSYLANEKIFDNNLLDCVMTTSNISVLDELISKDFTEVLEKESFCIWLCSVNRLEYLNRFYNELDLTYGKLKGNLLFRSIFYYGVLYRNIEILRKILLNDFINPDSFSYFRFFDDFSLENNENTFSKKRISIGQLILSLRSQKLIVFFVEEVYISEIFEMKINNYSQERLYLNDCFSTPEIARYFATHDSSKAIKSMLYHEKFELLDELVNENHFKNRLLDIQLFARYMNVPNIEKLLIYFASNSLLISEEVKKFLEICLKENKIDVFVKIFDIYTHKVNFDYDETIKFCFLITENKNRFNNCIEIETYINYFFEKIRPIDYFELLGYAVIGFNFELVEILLQVVNEINKSVYFKNLKVLDYLLNRFYNIKELNRCGNNTLLHFLIEACNKSNDSEKCTLMVKKLIELGVDISKKNNMGKTACEYIDHNYSNIDYSIIGELVYVTGANVCDKYGNLLGNYKNSNLPIINKIKSYISEGKDAVYAKANNDIELLNFYLDHGANEYYINLDYNKKYMQHINTDKPKSNSTVRSSSLSYTRAELNQMYRDAFDGDMDATWNVD